MDPNTFIKVGFFGFFEKDTAKFSKIFNIPRANKPVYHVKNITDTDSIDIIILNTTSASANQQCKIFHSQNPTVPIVTIGPKQSRYHLSGKLTVALVFDTLDSVPLTKLNVEENPLPIKESPNKIQNVDKAEVLKPISQTPESIKPSFQVLVVDDSEMMQKALQIELEQTNKDMHIDFAATGEEALQLVEKIRYDFIFLDIMMPGIDGFETCTQIRKKADMKKTPIIMLSSKTSPLDEVKGVMAGCTTYLTKPIKHDEFQKLLDRIMRWLENFKTQK